MEGVATCLDSVTIQLCEREAEIAGLRGRVRCQTFSSEAQNGLQQTELYLIMQLVCELLSAAFSTVVRLIV